MDLNNVQLEVKLQLKTPEVPGTNELIDTYGACSVVEPIELTIVVTTEIDMVRIRPPDRYRCNDGLLYLKLRRLYRKIFAK